MDKLRRWLYSFKDIDRVLFSAILAYFAILGVIYALQSLILVMLGDFGRLIVVLISGAVLIPSIKGMFQKIKDEKDDHEFGHTRDPRI